MGAINGVLTNELKNATKALEAIKAQTAQDIEAIKAECTKSIEWSKVESALELHKAKKALAASHEKEMDEMKAKIAALEESIVDREKFYLKVDGDRIEENRKMFESKEQHKRNAWKSNACMQIANVTIGIMNRYIDKLPLADVEAMQAEIDKLRRVDVQMTRQGPPIKNVKRRKSVVVKEILNQMYEYDEE